MKATRGKLRDLEAAVSKEVGGCAPKVALFIGLIALVALLIFHCARS